MRNTLLLVTWGFCLFLPTFTMGQGITLHKTNAPLTEIFTAIQQQSDFRFVYTAEKMTAAKPVSISVNQAIIQTVLEHCFRDQPLTYQLEDKFIMVREKVSVAPSSSLTLTGTVRDENGAPLDHATVAVKSSDKMTMTDPQGKFRLTGLPPNFTLMVSRIGYETQQLLLNNRTEINILLKQAIFTLDETVIKGYYNSSRRLNTGSVAKLSGEEIARQPVTNVLNALTGRIAGLNVVSSSGIPGASVKLELRGRNSIAQGNDPFIIIDGVPFAANNSKINQVNGSFTYDNNGLSPFNSLNPADIESIEVLKDADATAIYGSRGANGVILITTKKGKAGKTTFNFNLNTGGSQITRAPSMLSTSEYLRMRKEAFANDGVVPTSSDAYDFLVWDTSRYTDFRDLLIGGTAYRTDVQASLSGGNAQTQFLIGSSYHQETTVYPGDYDDRKAGLHVNLNHQSIDKQFSLGFSGTANVATAHLPIQDLANYLYLIPNLPALQNPNGSLAWSKDGYSLGNNPLALQLREYEAETRTYIGNLQLSYQIIKGLTVRANLGYNQLQVNEVSTTPITSQDPALNPTGSSAFGHTLLTALIAEPQLQYKWSQGLHQLDVLAGATFQQNRSQTVSVNASGYTNDGLLRSMSAAGRLVVADRTADYRYGAIFGRIGYTYADKYLLNLTARRDGSSRFGPGHQFAQFGAIGAGWVFSQEGWMKNHLTWLSFGKLRGSYGTTGNDGIGDYKYLDAYKPTNFPYQGNPSIYPSSLFNARYGWEKNKKLELALELGFMKDRLLLSAAWFRNQSSKQLVQYNLPTQTGFSSVIDNLDAAVENTGVELELTATVIRKENWRWTLSVNTTWPNNRLVSFPGLASSGYRYQYRIGQPLNSGSGYAWAGVNTQTGIFEYYDASGKITPTPDFSTDYQVAQFRNDPYYYGGIRNAVQYKRWQLEIFADYKKQQGKNYLNDIAFTPPGVLYNQPNIVMNRWQRTGDATPVQRFTQDFNSDAYQTFSVMAYDGASNQYSDASYLRIRNISLTYSFPDRWKKMIHAQTVNVYVQAQNLFTFTRHEGADPEILTMLRLPPLKTVVAGIQISF